MSVSDDERRTYGLGAFIALFTVVGLVGLLAVLFVGMGDGEARLLSTPQTLPDEATTEPVADPDRTSSSSTSSSTTEPGGPPEELPDGVREVLRDGGVTSYAFAVDEPTGDADLRAAVAPARVEPVGGGGALSVEVGCAVSSQESLAQLSVTEVDDTVTVLAVVVAPAGAPGCGGDTTRVVRIPLEEPVGDRAVVVVPPGSPVPDLGPAAAGDGAAG